VSEDVRIGRLSAKYPNWTNPSTADVFYGQSFSLWSFQHLLPVQNVKAILLITERAIHRSGKHKPTVVGI